MPLSAQCSGGGCPNSGGGTSATGCPTGQCPNAGRSNGGAVARKPATPDPAKIPAWQRPDAATLEAAAADELPIVLCFATEDSTDFEFYGDELTALSKGKAVFMKMQDSGDRESSPWVTESPVPTSKLQSDNPARDYDVDFGKGVVIVCDWHGNEHYRTDRKVRADKLEAMLAEIKEKVEDVNEKLQKNLEKANDYVADNDRKSAVKYLLKNFKEGVVGVDAQEASIRLYHEILDNARSEMNKLIEKGDKDGLKDLAKELKKTDVEKEIDEALEKLS